MKGRHNELIPVIKWKYIENAANAVIDRNHNGCRIVIKVEILYEPSPDIERGLRIREC